FWNRAHVSRPVTERLVLAGGFDTVYGIDAVGAAVDPGHAHRPRHRGVRAAHAPGGGARGYAPSVGEHEGLDAGPPGGMGPGPVDDGPPHEVGWLDDPSGDADADPPTGSPMDQLASLV